MEAVYFEAGLMPSSVIMSLANSTSPLANLKFAELNTRPFLLHWERMLHILWKAPSMVSECIMMSSTIFSNSL